MEFVGSDQSFDEGQRLSEDESEQYGDIGRMVRAHPAGDGFAPLFPVAPAARRSSSSGIGRTEPARVGGSTWLRQQLRAAENDLAQERLDRRQIYHTATQVLERAEQHANDMRRALAQAEEDVRQARIEHRRARDLGDRAIQTMADQVQFLKNALRDAERTDEEEEEEEEAVSPAHREPTVARNTVGRRGRARRHRPRRVRPVILNMTSPAQEVEYFTESDSSSEEGSLFGSSPLVLTGDTDEARRVQADWQRRALGSPPEEEGDAMVHSQEELVSGQMDYGEEDDYDDGPASQRELGAGPGASQVSTQSGTFGTPSSVYDRETQSPTPRFSAGAENNPPGVQETVLATLRAMMPRDLN